MDNETTIIANSTTPVTGAAAAAGAAAPGGVSSPYGEGGSLDAAFWAASRSLPCWGETNGLSPATTTAAATNDYGQPGEGTPSSSAERGGYFESPMDFPAGLMRLDLDSFVNAFRALSFPQDPPPQMMHPVSREVFMRVQQQQAQFHRQQQQQQQAYAPPVQKSEEVDCAAATGDCWAAGGESEGGPAVAAPPAAGNEPMDGNFCYLPAEGNLDSRSCTAGSLAHQLLLLSSTAPQFDGAQFDGLPGSVDTCTPVSAFLRQLEGDLVTTPEQLVASLLRQSAPGRLREDDLGSPQSDAAPPPAAEPTAPAWVRPAGYIEGDDAILHKDRSIAELKGRVVSLAKVQYGSRLLQRLLARGSVEHIKLILAETSAELPSLMVDPYGNYLCQQLFEVCGQTQRRQILMRLAPCTVRIAEDRRGTHSLQSLIGLVGDEREELLLLEPMLVSADILALSTHPHATHVIQRALTSCGPKVKAMIFEPVIQRLSDVARTPHGICVVKRCISAAASESSCAQFKAPLLRKLSAAAIGLIQSPYGNYAVQHALDVFGPEFCRPILRQVAEHFVLLSTQKFSSNVVEKSIAVGCDAEIARLVRTATQPAVVKALLSSSYGSFVIQKLLTRMDDGDAMKLLRLLMQCHGELGSKRLRSKWERLVTCLADRFGIDSTALLDSEVGANPVAATLLGDSLQPPPYDSWKTTSAAPSTAPSTPPPEFHCDWPATQHDRKNSTVSVGSSQQTAGNPSKRGSASSRNRRWRSRRKPGAATQTTTTNNGDDEVDVDDVTLLQYSQIEP